MQGNPFAAVDAGVEGALKLVRDRTPKAVPDLVVDVPVTLEELFVGASKVIVIVIFIFLGCIVYLLPLQFLKLLRRMLS